MSNNRCKHAEEQIQLLIDGRITPADRDALDQHLGACPSCASHLEEYRALSRRAAGWAKPTLADDPGDAFNAAILRSIAAPMPTPGQLGWLPLAAAALLIGACAGLWRIVSAGAVSLPLLDAPRISLIGAWTTGLPLFSASLPILGRGSIYAITPSFLMIAALAALLINAWFIFRHVGGRRMDAGMRAQ